MLGRLEVWGGTTEHGRACYYVSVGDKSLLLDCGINIVTGEMPEIDYDKLDKVDCILLTHSHEDHSKGIVELLKKGHPKKVIMTEETGRQLDEMYSEELKQYAHEFIFVEKIASHLEWFKLSDHIELCYGASGHMYGAIWFLIKIYDKTIFYSGDYNRQVQILPFHVPEKSAVLDPIDLAIIDCANGMQKMNAKINRREMHDHMDHALRQKGQNLFIANRFSKVIETIILLREQYPNLVFYYDEALYYEIVRQVKSISLFKQFRDESLNRHSENFRAKWFEKANFIFLDQDVLYLEKQLAVESFLQNGHNQMWLTSKASFMKHQDELQGPSTERVFFCDIEAHQGVNGVIELLNALNINKALLCHLDGHENLKSVKFLKSKGFYNVDICQIKASVAF
ncbi:MBL fold metallo-hydrolase [Fusibacter sp. 3D3]|uniref:MBL fold metallo-hydrolase n=1 Tax=Fusibacter sp. 3D3 TaxID=1048380 RepID=UPI000853ED0E|nr:MBL fold metallo-hydrolase [Fusibacter sp. 3D3]GAU79239.1 Zn-dependent hydrolase [Fusibacter sp. 3D3]